MHLERSGITQKTMNTTDFNFGDIVLVPFPFTDQSSIKKRPTVVVSSNEYNQHRLDIVIMAITSQLRSSGHFGDVVVNGWQSAGLLKPSVIKPVLTTIEKNLVIKILGRIDDKDRSSLHEALHTIIGE